MKSLYSDLPEVNIGGKTFVGRVVFGLLVLASAVIGALAGLVLVYSTDLPQVSELERYRPSSITELYDDQGRVIGTFALQRRVIATYPDFSKNLYYAVVAIEDKDFDSHWGIDLQRLFGVIWRELVHPDKRAQGASTLTMQLSRNLFLSADRTASRKIQEILLSIQIERRFTKEQIFTMYGNQIYLGSGVYGFEAGAEYYFNKHAKDLTITEAAMLASLPKSPIQYSPIFYPEAAKRRRNLVINAMLEDGRITLEQANAAKAEPIKLDVRNSNSTIAPYFVEEIRQYLEKKYGTEEVHQNGLRVYTTLDLEMQHAANQAALDGVAAYERRHGWKGKQKHIDAKDMAKYRHDDWQQPFEVGGYTHALVTQVDAKTATVKFGHHSAVITAEDMKWTQKKSPPDILSRGDIAYVRIISVEPAKVALEQDSGTQVALMAIDNNNGDIKAMVGGRDFEESKFNRATQAMRQVGSSFKPYVYTAALDEGTMEPDGYILDAPVTFMTASGPYRPSNYDGKFWGNIPVRTAVANSRNIPALKIAEKTGIKNIIAKARKFGITAPLPEVLPLALGAAEITLYEQTAGFSTFPNDGVRVAPRYIKKVTDYDGHVKEENFPEVRDVISAKTARTMVSLLEGVVQNGTAAKAKVLKHPVAGKTGTTNDFTDAWFVGFSPSITCGVWIGYDEKVTLGPKETGGEAALPIWIDFMKVALKGREKETFIEPEPDAAARRTAAVVKAPPQTTSKVITR
jgi:penicillin-binding protein 1A